MSTHYVAHLKIEKIEKTEGRTSGHRQPYEATPVIEPKREVSEVTQMTIKGASLDSLVEKLGKHIGIIEED